jgi:hypothetical protein
MDALLTQAKIAQQIIAGVKLHHQAAWPRDAV